MASSSSSTRGPVASARATSRRRRSGSVSARASRSACVSSPTTAKAARAAARAAAGSRVRLNAPIAALPRTDSPGNGWTIWKVRAIPSRQSGVRTKPGDVSAIEADPSRRRPVEARDQVEERGLARSVRADEADQLSGLDVEGHVGNGDEPSEALGEPPKL